MRLILASSSERRIALLKEKNVKFEVIPSNVNEDFSLNLTPRQIVKLLSDRKAESVARQQDDDSIIIGADTIVYIDNQVLGKPDNEQSAFEMLSMLSGKTHVVYTGVSLYKNKKYLDGFVDKSSVTFRRLSKKDIQEYIDTKEPFGKAGSYAIQGIGKKLVDSYSGDVNTIIGLPIDRLLKLLSLYL